MLLDAGDAVSAGNITFHREGEPILDLMSSAGYDAMTIGNREFHFSQMGLRATLSRAKFPVLCANLRPVGSPSLCTPLSPGSADDEPVSLLPDIALSRYHLFENPAIGRIVVFGLTVPMITERMLARKVSAYVFDAPIPTAARLVPYLRARFQPDLLIALTHIGLGKDRTLAESVPGIDLIVGGHSHNILPEGERVGETLIVQTGCYAHSVGIVTIARREEPEGGFSFQSRLEAL